MDGYLAAIRPVFDRVTIYEGPARLHEGLSHVSEAQGLLFAAHWCTSEICNGGHHQLFQNPTGVLAPEGVRGLERIGLSEAAGIVADAIAMFGPAYPREREPRVARLRELEGSGRTRAEWDPFYALDNRFYDVAGTERFRVAADRFVLENRELFAR